VKPPDYLLLFAGATAVLGTLMWPRPSPVARIETIPVETPVVVVAPVPASSRPSANSSAAASDAVENVLRLPDSARVAAASDLLLELSDQPEVASEVARQLARRDKSFVREHGASLIATLAANGDFIGAMVFAELGGPERPLWLGQALMALADQDPALAAHAAMFEFDGEGFPEIAAIWAKRDPAAFAAFANRLPDNLHRSIALERLRSADPR
jgi:hypothetical protein